MTWQELGLPDTWLARADELEHLTLKANAAKRKATETHATAYLAHDGPGVIREQVAKKAAAEAVQAYDDALAAVTCYRLLLDFELRQIHRTEMLP